MQEDMEGILHILQNVENHIGEDDEDKLVDSIFNLVYPQWVYEEIPKLEINHLNMFTWLIWIYLINGGLCHTDKSERIAHRVNSITIIIE